MPYATNTELIARIEKIASDNRDPLSITDHALLARRNGQAYNAILAALRARGVDKIAADNWARGNEFQLDIATYWVLLDLAPSGGGGPLATRYDRTAELATVELLDSSGAAIGTATGGYPFQAIDLTAINDTLGL